MRLPLAQRIGATRDAMSGVGFVEMLLLVTIVGILTAVAVQAPVSDDLVLDSAARGLVADIHRARGLAIESRRPVGLHFDVSANRCAFILDSGAEPAAEESALRTDPDLTPVQVERLLDARASGDPALSPVILAAADFGGDPKLIFDADGSSRDGGLVDLTLSGTTLRVRVQLGTGRVVITSL